MLTHVVIHSFLHGSLRFPQPLQHVRIIFHFTYETIISESTI
jgi:hypothetical protein